MRGADEKVLRPLLAGVQAKLRDLEGKRASSSTAPSRPSAPPPPAAKRARDDPPPRPAQLSWAPAPRDPGGENTTAVHRKSSPKPKAPKHDWSAGRKQTQSFSDDEDTFPVRKAVNNRDRGGGTERREGKNHAASFQSAGERLDAENARRGVPPAAAAARRGSVPSAPHDGGHGGASTTVARNGFVPPYVRKAFTGPNGGQMPRNGGGGGNNAGQQRNGGNNGRTMNGGANDANDEPPFSEQVMRRLAPHDEPIPDELLKMDRDIVERVVSEILEAPASIGWKDIAGLKHAKAAVQELAVWPLMKPELFRGARSVPRGLLLFGPPGTGKTLIGRAVASQCGATFFSISASSLTSKWIGEGEKMVRALFAVARCCEPAVIFVDEIDSLLSARKSDGEHESSRRMKTEFLVQMDGLGGDDGASKLFIFICKHSIRLTMVTVVHRSVAARGRHEQAAGARRRRAAAAREAAVHPAPVRRREARDRDEHPGRGRVGKLIF